MELLLLALRILGGIVFLLAPIAIYSWADTEFTQRTVDAIGKEWCIANSKKFIRVQRFKTHFALIYRESENERRRKFIAHFRPFSWQVSNVTWLST